MFLIVIGHQSIHNRMRQGFISQVPIVYYDILLYKKRFWLVLHDRPLALAAMVRRHTHYTIALHCECCERGCVTASNQSVYDFEGCVAEYVHASHASK